MRKSESRATTCRKQFVGLVPLDRQTVVAEGAQLVMDPDAEIPIPILGHVTSSYASAALGHPISLALLKSGRERKGQQVVAIDSSGTRTAVEVVSSVFYDPQMERQNVG